MVRYYAHINSKDILTGIDMSTMIADEYGSSEVQNIEVSEDVYAERDKYIYSDGKIILNPEYSTIELNNKKEELIAENDRLRDEKLLEGVTYNNVLFDSDTDQKINILAIYGTMTDDNTIVWYGKDNQGLLCTKNDLLAIGNLITELHSYCWGNNAYIKEQIENAQNLEELENVIINYEDVHQITDL